MQNIINKLYEQQALTQSESQELFDHIIRGEMDPILMSAVLTATKWVAGTSHPNIKLTYTRFCVR